MDKNDNTNNSLEFKIIKQPVIAKERRLNSRWLFESLNEQQANPRNCYE